MAKNVSKDVSISMTGNTTTGDSRIVELMGYKTDLVIYDYLVIMRYSDKPGMLGQIGTILGEFDVDIRFLKVASKEESNLALVAMAVNCPVPDEARERLESGVVDEAWYLSF